MGRLSLPSQNVVCPKCLNDYFDDHKKQTCPYCNFTFVVGEYPNPVNGEDLWRYVYKDWYLVSCAKSKEKPVSFDAYKKIATRDEVRTLFVYLTKGMKP